ncbi:fungal transcriptional regulatory protein [Scheffersomyces xylosifermentans]|uniref:fungal transcriptional regulatory protein n=1 Tax=Scheffersomyces xylosifermentans TaxID=1304137 RepID=UPI00315DAFC8
MNVESKSMSKRLVKTCDYCRLRKVKCDKEYPCATCKKKGRQCTIGQGQSVPSGAMKRTIEQDIESLKAKIRRLEPDSTPKESIRISYSTLENKSEKETVNLYRDYRKVTVKGKIGQHCYGPFSWVTLMTSDPALHHAWEFIGANGKEAILGGESFSEESLKSYDSTKHELLSGLVLPDPLSRDPFIPLDSKILSLLPNQKVIWTLIRRFFKEVYPYVPLIDERDFRRDIERIIDEESFELTPILELQMEGQVDVAIIGILLVILRLSYLSYFSNDLALNDSSNIASRGSKSLELKFILENPISLSFIQLAQKCLDEFNIFERSNVTVLQLALLLRTYRHLAPEEQDGLDGGGSMVLTATLVSMASNLGLSRDPDDSMTKRECNLFRKLAVHMKSLDATECVSCGTPSCVSRRYIDINCPSYELDNSNLIDTEYEKEIISSYMQSGMVFRHLVDFYDAVVDLQNSIQIEDLEERLAELKEVLSADAMGDLPQSLANTFKIKSYLLGQQLILTIHFLMVIHYDSKQMYSKSAIFIKETLKLIKLTIIPTLQTIIENQLNNMSMLSTAPVLQTIAIKTLVILCSLLLRTNLSLQVEDGEHVEKRKLLVLFSVALRDSCVDLLELVSIFTTRYYYFWRIIRGWNGLLKICFAKEFYEPLKKDPKNFRLNFTSHDIQEVLPYFYKSTEASISTHIDVSAAIAAKIPNIMSTFITEIDLSKFWRLLKRDAKTNDTMKRLQKTSGNMEDGKAKIDIDFLSDFYSDFLQDPL